MMLSGSLTDIYAALLKAARNMHLIDTWKTLRPSVVVCRGDANFYVELDALERLLTSFCGDC